MPVDNWLILALIMIFSSILLCGIVPIIIRLSIARRRYRLELENIASSIPDIFLNLQSIYQNIEIKSNEDINSHQHSIIYSQIPFIDDLDKEDDTFV